MRIGSLTVVTLLTLTCVLRLIWAERDPTRAFAFEVWASSPEPQSIQLYFVREPDPGLSEAASVSATIRSTELRAYRLHLRPGIYRAFRFDPARQGGVLRFAQARIVDNYSGEEICALPVSTWQEVQQIEHTAVVADALEVVVASRHSDPNFAIPLASPPLVLKPRIGGRVWVTVLAVFVAILVPWVGRRLVNVAPIRRLTSRIILTALDALIRRVGRFIPREALPVDRFAIGFISLVCCAGLIATAFQLHGSSSTMRSRIGIPIGNWEPAFGVPRTIRWDEWCMHTPVILHQIHRAEPFAADSKIIGPAPTMLIGNAPVRHWTAIFRPQFYPFFVLPAEHAFAAYWQSKHVLLLTGTFLLFLLLTRSSRLAAFGAVWFWISSFTQWAFSWPSLLPEMIAFGCWGIVATCLLFAASSRKAALAMGVMLVFAGMAFVLCSYPPFQVPFAWAGAGIVFAWLLQQMIARRQRPAEPQPTIHWARGIIMGTAAAALLAVGIALFAREIWPLVQTTAQTLYPGNRSLSGGGVSWTQLALNFVDPLRTEAHTPLQFSNICEGSGYLWFGVLSAGFAVPAIWTRSRAYGVVLYVSLLAPLVLLLLWALCPIPAEVGRFLLLNKVQSTRVLPAIGLLNIALALVFLRWLRPNLPALPTSRRLIHGIVATFLFFVVLWSANHAIADFFDWRNLAVASIILGLATDAMRFASVRAFAAWLLVPLLWANLLINPLDRGLALYHGSSLSKLLEAHSYQDGRWLVITEDATVPFFFAALGLDVFNTLHFVPDLDAWRLFDPAGERAQFYNGSGMTIVRALSPGASARIDRVEGSALGPPIFRRLDVDPADPRLRTLGVRYYAIEGTIRTEIFPASDFECLTEAPVDGFTIYRRR